MDSTTVGILLIALAGFLIGGVYSTWKTAKALAMVLGAGVLLSVGGAIAWFVS